jgi:hypothetical protein
VKSKTLFLVVLAVTALLASNVCADYDPYVDPYEPGFESIDLEADIRGISQIFKGEIKYEVYAPSTYLGDITMLGGGDVSVPTDHFVYQYQVISEIGFGAALYLELVPGSGAENFGYAASGEGSDVIPVDVADVPTQAFYGFFLQGGEHSAMLLFTSLKGPTEGVGVVSSVFAGDQAVVVPVPGPEPITLIMLGAGCLPLRFYRKRLRKAA